TVSVGANPAGVAVNPVTNRIYVANHADGNVTVINGIDNTTSTVVAGTAPGPIAVNSVTNRIYVVNMNTNNVTVINGADSSTATVTVGTFPVALAVNSVSNRIYVANESSANVTVINGTDNSTIAVKAGNQATFISANPVTNKIYLTDITNNVTVIDGATNTTSIVSTAGFGANGLAVDSVNNKVCVTNGNSSNLTVIAEQQVQPIPLTVAITPLPGNQTANPRTTFTFTTNSAFSPNAPPVQSVYYQVDAWQGPWLQATGSAPNFSGTLPSLASGIHVIYAYATDGQVADSIQPGSSHNGQSSPLISTISAYLFLVLPQNTVTRVELTSGSNPANFGDSLMFTATVLPQFGGTPTGTVQFQDQGINLGSPVTLTSGTAALETSTLSLGTHLITAVYSGDISFFPSISAAWTQVVKASGGTSSSQIVLNTTPQTFFRLSASFSVTVTSAGGTPSGN